MKVVCINAESSQLVEGGIYNTEYGDSEHYLIFNGIEKRYWRRDRFITVKEYRKRKLRKLSECRL